MSQTRNATQKTSAPPSGQDSHDTHRCCAMLNEEIVTYAEDVTDTEKARITVQNLLRDQQQRKGQVFEDPGLTAVLDQLDAREKASIKALEGAIKRHPLGPWIAAQKGLGLKQMGRFLACLGADVLNGRSKRSAGAGGEPCRRAVGQLWEYCGHGRPSKRTRGQQSWWDPEAKMRIHLIAEQCIKYRCEACSEAAKAEEATPAADCSCARDYPFRAVYDATRKHYAEAVHTTPCPQCGPRGKPAQPGSPLSDGHKHARALRKVAKEILRNLWIEADRLDG